MKINLKKVSAIATSALMVGMTMGVAAAANYPAPFRGADVAVVWGSGTGVSSLDQVGANLIEGDLLTSAGGGSTVTGGDSYKFEKSSTKFHLGDAITTVVSSSLDDDELPTLLADGLYVDDDNDEFDYTQTITMGSSLTLTMFEDNDYVEDQPTVGFRVPSSTNVLNYTLDFSDEPLMTDLTTTDIPIMGKMYYILSIGTSGANTVFTLLDSAEDTVLAEGETVTVSGKSVSVEYLSSSEVRLNVDGTVTNSLNEGETQKLADGSYLGVKDILFNSKEGTVSSVEFSVGSGKLTLTGGSEVQMNEETVSGITAYITNTTAMDKLVLQWKTEDDEFIATDSTITMPGFEVVKLSYGGLTYPTEEEIMVEQGGELYAQLNNFPLKDGMADIDFLYATTAGTFSGIGKDADNRLITNGTTAGTANLTFDSDTDEYFVVSWSDGKDAESYLVRAQNFVTESLVDKVDFMYWTGSGFDGTGQKATKNGDTFSIGNVELAVGAVSNADNTVRFWNNSANTNFNTLYSAEGLKVYLPYSANGSQVSGAIDFNDSDTGVGGTGHNGTSFFLVMREEDKDDDKGEGDWINATIGWDNSATKEVEVSDHNSTNPDGTSTEIGDTDVWRDFTYSDLATEILFTKPSSGQKSLKLVYHGEEVSADVYISSPEASVVTGETGSLVVRDSEINSVSSKHLVVVGGSCINTVASNLLGGAGCGSSFTSATNVGSGQFLIQSLNSPYATGKVALVVAGYEVDDTTNAVTYLRTQKPSTDVGRKYVGTSSLSAELVVE